MKKLVTVLLTIASPFIYTQSRIGASWIEQDPGVNTSLNCVDVYWDSEADTWICGDNGVILKSSNENETWQKVNSNIPQEIKLVTISVTDSAVLTAGNIGNDSYVYRSVDDGKSWHLVFTQPGGRINSIINVFDSLTRIYMSGNPVGGRWSLWKSYNNGLTWDSAGMFIPQAGNETGLPNSLYEGYNFIWFGTNNNRIYNLSNSGFFWQAYPVPENSVYSIIMSEYYCYAAGGNLLFSTNGGYNWINKFADGSGPIKSLIYYRDFMPTVYYDCGPYHIWYIRGNKIYYSCDNITWRAEHSSSRGNYTSMTKNPYRLYAVTDAGRISKSIVLYDSSVISPNSFMLMQNYPNPFNASTNIKLRLYKSANLKINVYNSAGELVVNLLDNPFVIYTEWPYFYYLEVNWDGTNQPTGVYFYQVIADDYKETKKMILVK